jgi:hypothetical protein
MGNDYFQYAKDMAKAERELKIEPWVEISLQRRLPDRTNERLHRYDLPREMLERWRWVINWRMAQLQCKYPRSNITAYHHYYDKRTGLETGYGSLLSKISAAKAQITKVERAIAAYIEFQSANNLFFDPETDEMLLKANKKLKQKKRNYENRLALLEQEVKKQTTLCFAIHGLSTNRKRIGRRNRTTKSNIETFHLNRSPKLPAEQEIKTQTANHS